MSNNIPKKLALKAEIIKYLDIAKEALARTEMSTQAKVWALNMDAAVLEGYGEDPKFLPLYKEYLERKNN